MSDVFRAVTLCFLIAVIFLLLSAGVDYLAIYHLQSGDDRYTPQENFQLALANSSLLASLLCVWALLATAFAKKYVNRLRPGLSVIAALCVAIPLVATVRLLPLLDPRALWSPTVGLVISLLWSSIGLHGVLWYLTASPQPSNDV